MHFKMSSGNVLNKDRKDKVTDEYLGILTINVNTFLTNHLSSFIYLLLIRKTRSKASAPSDAEK